MTLLTLVSSKSYSLPFAHRTNIARLALNPRGNLLLSVDENGRAILTNIPAGPSFTISPCAARSPRSHFLHLDDISQLALEGRSKFGTHRLRRMSQRAIWSLRRL